MLIVFVILLTPYQHSQIHALPRGILTPLNGVTQRQTEVERGAELSNSTQRAAMKEQFQRDIDDTVAEILAEEEAMSCHQSSTVAMELNFGGKVESN